MKKGRLLILTIIVLVVAAATGAWIGLRSPEGSTYRADVVQALSAESSNLSFKRAMEIRPFQFPADFGPHPQFQTEWWYYTGNLVTDEGNRFGFQLTFFRQALSDKPVEGESLWRSNQIYFAHFAVTDIKNQQFYSFERFSRGALGLAGAAAEPYQVWVEDWKVEQKGNSVQLRADQNGIQIKLRLVSQKPIVLQGTQGLSRKGREPGNASYYFSQTRLATAGTITIANKITRVTGFSWLDKEWSSSVLEAGDTGWDWFSIQLNDNRELMLFQIRSKSGNISPFSSGSYIDPTGNKTHLTKDQFTITPTRQWKSPQTGATYPAAWRIEIPSQNLRLTVLPYLNQQEHQLSFRYWEGAVQVSSDSAGGHGYVEMTGY